MTTADAYAHRTIALGAREPDTGGKPSTVGWTLIDAAVWGQAADACGWPRPVGTYNWQEWK